MLGRHDFSNDGQPGLSTSQSEQFEPLLFQSLETVRAGARLEGSATQTRGTGVLDGVRDVEDLLPALDRARAGDHADLSGTNGQLAHRDTGALLLDLGAG